MHNFFRKTIVRPGHRFTLSFSLLKSLRRPYTLEVRLHDHIYQSNTEVIFYVHSDWLVRSELGYFVRSLISGLNDGAGTLKDTKGYFHEME